MASPRAFDLVLWGSTGFTGRLVAKYLAETIDRRLLQLRWAIVGRDRGRVDALQRELSVSGLATPEVLVATASVQEEVDRVVSQSRVLLSTAGPFAAHGTPVVDACVRLGCDYVDINGEVGWHREMIERYDEEARRKGVVLIPSAGFDSIPSDLGAHWMASRIQEEFGVPARRVDCYVSLDGQFSGGTVASGILSDETHGERLADPFLLCGERRRTPRAEDEDLKEARYNSALGAWTAPFGMAPINTRIVRRSVALLEQEPSSPFSRDFTYTEAMVVPTQQLAEKVARAATAPAAVRRQLVEKGRLPKPGEGPSAEQRASSWFRLVLVAEASGEEKQQLVGSVSGGDPGYSETSKMVAETALMLACEREALPTARGFLTPASAGGAVLRSRLHHEGILFEALGKDALPLGGMAKL
ncbi:hypothetical protein AB1Y20_007871 [Prymnesium parvum]|uniref:Saccharopine dehydrogenase NADP binding domain-containing protein n=1 Tax=Prymnesium parvum TaxID=97485 RepID=A0AB34IUZ6_PRYPA